MMKKTRIYIDTSIVGGFFDKVFAAETRALFQRLENNEVTFVVSDLLREELQGAPKHVRNLLENYSNDKFETVLLTDEAKELADNYIAENIVGKTSLDDCHNSQS